ncbi:hypothetical protein [Pseudomonas viridiflava]|uniref:hypothetical protein n=1 Tax=Pseudomonas viridiflava TaxID=33069 RepID=UPI000F011424|nr:hypothetical protein [Pseudomonas viridiflava]
MKTKNTPEQTAANIATVIELRQAGNTRDQIIEITKFPARFIREHMKGVPILAKPAKVTQLSVAASKAYILAIRPQGCKDYELRNIAHEVYGTKVDAEKGITTAAYSKDTLYSIKKRVYEMAVGELTDGEAANPQFVMDWICDERPAASRVALEVAALELSRRFDDMLSEFMCEFMVEPDSDELTLTEAQLKQRYAARRHMLKLAFPEFNSHGEPLSTLLARSESQTDALEAKQDLPVVQTPIRYFENAVVPSESFDGAMIDAGSIDPFFEEVDVFADVTTATKEQIVINKAQQDAKIAAFTETISSDDGVKECDSASVEEFGNYTDEEYGISLEAQSFMAGFDLTQYAGGRINVEGVSFS